MPTVTTHAIAVIGIEGFLLDIEASAVQGPSSLHLHGLPDATARETQDRVQAAIINAGLHRSHGQITVSLLPASLPKHGSSFDLAIAVAALAANDEAIPSAALSKVVFAAELGLDGSLRPVRAMTPTALAAAQAGCSAIVVAHANAAEAGLPLGLQVIAADTLTEVITWLTTGTPPSAPRTPAAPPAPKPTFPDLADLRLPEAAALALQVAAAGGHHLLITGRRNPARYGRALPPLLPDLTPAAALEATAIHSAAGLVNPHDPLITRPPYRTPAPTSTPDLLCGNASSPALPGEIALAHQGILHLANAADFSTSALELLRQPLNDRQITVTRSGSITRFPADIQLVLTTAPCPCSALCQTTCECDPQHRTRYLDRLLSRLGNNIDLTLNLDDLSSQTPLLTPAHITTAQATARIAEARARASSRLANTSWTKNGHIPLHQMRRYFMPSTAALRPLEAAIQTGSLSIRTAIRITRIAWTISDLAGLSEPTAEHIETALELSLPTSKT